MHRLEHVVRDARADHLQQHGRGHRQAEPEDGLVGLLHRVAVLERVQYDAHHAGEDAVDDEARARPRASTGACAVRATSYAVASGDVVGVRRPDSSTSGSTLTGLKKCDADVGAHLGDRERSTCWWRGCSRAARARAARAKTCFFTLQLLEDRLEHEVAVVEALVARRGRRRSSARKRALPSS